MLDREALEPKCGQRFQELRYELPAPSSAGLRRNLRERLRSICPSVMRVEKSCKFGIDLIEKPVALTSPTVTRQVSLGGVSRSGDAPLLRRTCSEQIAVAIELRYNENC